MQSEIRDIIDRCYIDPIIYDSGYNIVNTVTWALVLGVCIFGVQKVLRHLNIVIDRHFVIGVVCYVLFGSSLRVLEDADMFGSPLKYLFETPFIYFVVFFVTVTSLAISLRIYRERYYVAFSIVGLVLTAINICVLLWYEDIIYPVEALLIVILTVLITSAIYLSSRRMNIRFLSSRFNIAILGAHLFDASSTTVGVDLLNYYGKHVVENYLIGITGTGAVMYPLKLFVFIPLLYLIDSDFDDDELRDLLKLTVLVLGLAPACRNTITILFWAGCS
ncbi:MAG: DUF63 family protein [Methanosarcinales archaeon]|nr:MAG: DUF63 family protein [Methanosarcinales archaeon]